MENLKRKETDEIDFIEILIHIWLGRKKIVYIIGTFVLTAIIFLLFATPWYAATVKIMPEKSDNTGGLMGQYAGLAAMAGISLSSNGSQYELYPDIIKSNFILDRILEHKFTTSNSHLPITLFEFWGTEIDSSKVDWKHILYEEAKKDLRDNYINAYIDKRTNLLTITVTAPKDPTLAAKLVNFVARNLDQYNKNFRNYKTSDQITYIEKSIKTRQIELDEVVNKLKSFLEKNKDFSSPDKQLEHEMLKTELDVQQTIFIELRKQKELAEIEKIKETETINVLEYAEVPIEIYKPKKILVLFLFTLVGLIVSFFYIFFNVYWINNNIFNAISSRKVPPPTSS